VTDNVTSEETSFEFNFISSSFVVDFFVESQESHISQVSVSSSSGANLCIPFGVCYDVKGNWFTGGDNFRSCNIALKKPFHFHAYPSRRSGTRKLTSSLTSFSPYFIWAPSTYHLVYSLNSDAADRGESSQYWWQ